MEPALRRISAVQLLDILNFKCLLVLQMRILSKELNAQVWHLREELETELSISQVSATEFKTIVLGEMTKEMS